MATMASNLPIPLPPRTPTPPTPNPPSPTSETPVGLGLGSELRAQYDYDVQQGSPEREGGLRTGSTASLLSPESATFSVNGGLSPPNAFYSPVTPPTASTDGGFGNLDAVTANNGATNPFNFTTQQYAPPSQATAGKSELLKGRRGHKYRHSSIHAVHMDAIFKPPPSARTPLSVPGSLPMPTRKEAWWSMTKHQTMRLTWCLCHFLIAGYVQFSGAGSLAMTALSRLLLFDAAGATVCVVVDVMGNFEVWKRSSIKHPFGLERADVLAGFGMAVFIAFMGLDVISHGIQHMLENVGTHVAHSPHAHERVGTVHVDTASLLSIVSTMVSAVLLKNHARIGKAMRLELLAGWGKILGNPSHFLTLSCSLLMLLLPFLTEDTYGLLDKALSFIIAGLMIALGVRLATSLASMLLMSFRPPGKGALELVIDDIANADSSITNVDEARFWQVHYGLCMANLKMRYRGSRGGYGMNTDDMTRIRKKAESLIRERLNGWKWDVSVQLSVETD
ncbi:putative zinc transporter zrg17 [Fulvia fulva]|nr:putative zinc transporter zrg17 [Fulvia fulva]KAK4620765.1 putative zinc transporter zrg17 [Fulvia fulva]WPV17457.1 putative zinc transporter zrg17 [Fulvia fulva]WPV32289.1 putative zinc transporter zrg17 [Fulvia fulva]